MAIDKIKTSKKLTLAWWKDQKSFVRGGTKAINPCGECIDTSEPDFEVRGMDCDHVSIISNSWHLYI